MYRRIGIIVWLSLLVFTGCFNRSGTSPFGTSARVSAPSTYNLRIPSLANNQPYYVPDQRQQVAALPNINPPAPQVNPNAPAPTLVADNRNVNGWNLLSGVANPPQNALANQTPVYQTPAYQTPYAVQANRGVPTSNLQVAVASTLPNVNPSGNPTLASQTNPNLNRNDSTRLAAIDVSAVRAPVAGGPQVNPSMTPAVQNQMAARGPQQYYGQFQNGGVINPSPSNNGFVQPMPNRLASQPTGGTYQSPFVRSTGALGPGVNQQGGSFGWVARDNERPASR